MVILVTCLVLVVLQEKIVHQKVPGHSTFSALSTSSPRGTILSMETSIPETHPIFTSVTFVVEERVVPLEQDESAEVKKSWESQQVAARSFSSRSGMSFVRTCGRTRPLGRSTSADEHEEGRAGEHLLIYCVRTGNNNPLTPAPPDHVNNVPRPRSMSQNSKKK